MEDNKKDIGLTDAQLALSVGADPLVLAEGLAFIEAEKKRTQGQTLRSHWKGAFFSIALSTALIMEGYDSIVGSFYDIPYVFTESKNLGQPQFQRKFGTLQHDGKYAVSANWQAAIGNCSTAGNIVGVLLTGYFQERFGSKRVYICGMFLLSCAIFLVVFAQNIGMFMAAVVINALPFGTFQTLTTAYAAEICPIALRGLLASFVNLAWEIGLCLNAAVGRGTLTIPNDWAWRLPYTLQWIWPIPLSICCYFAPESPWWLVRKGRFEDAKQSLIAVAQPGFYDGRNLDAYVAYMKHVDDMEKAEAKKGSIKECFTGTDLRRTEIMFGIWLIQQLSGQAISSLCVQLLESTGLSVDGAFDVNVATYIVGILGTLLAWVVIPHFGRRTLYLASLLSIGCVLIVIGILAFTVHSNGGIIAIAVLTAFTNMLYCVAVGPLCYTIAGELPNSRVRNQSIALGRGVYLASSFVLGQINTRFVSPTSWNIGAKSAFFWLGTNVCCTIWCYFRLPETGGFSFAELDILFANKISARKFTSTTIHDEVIEHKQDVQSGVHKAEVEHVEEKAPSAVHALEDR